MMGKSPTLQYSLPDYQPIAGGYSATVGTEAYSQISRLAGTWSLLWAVCPQHSASDYIHTRIAGSSGNQVVQLTATGSFQDTTHSDTITATQLLDVLAASS